MQQQIRTILLTVLRAGLAVVCVLPLQAQTANLPNPLCVNLTSHNDSASSDEDTDGVDGTDELIGLIGPTGRLRAAINYASAIDGQCIDPATGKACSLSGKPPAGAIYSGIGVDLSCELAARLDVPLDIVAYSGKPAETAGFYADAWDIGFSYDPITGLPVGMAAGHPHLLIELTFVVPAGTPYNHVADVPLDAVINVAAGTSGVFLLSNLGYTNVHQVANGPAALNRVQFGEIAAVGRSIGVPFANTPANNARIMPDDYGYGHGTMATRAGSPESVHYLSVFVEWAKKKGLIQQAIDRVTPALIGVRVPPPEKVGGAGEDSTLGNDPYPFLPGHGHGSLDDDDPDN